MLSVFNEIWRVAGRRRANLYFRRKRRIIRSHFDVDDIPDYWFIERFRVNKIIFEQLCHMLTPYLREPIYQSAGVSVEQKVIVALRFYATGCYQRGIGEDFNIAVSQTSAHRYIHEVTNAIYEHLTAAHIKFPTTREAKNEIKQQFMDKFNFPSVIGAVDGTHIAILKPAQEEHNFINRKGSHSLNVQVICDAELKILSVFSNYGGSTHDAFIWQNSRVKEYCHEQFLGGEQKQWLIGDSGYPLEPYLMTPFLNPPDNSPESRYNYAHIRARNCIERCIGVLKIRFRCLLKERVCRYNAQFVGKLFNACAVLHNLCVDYNVDIQDRDHIGAEDEVVQNYHNNIVGNLHNIGERFRNDIVNRYYRNA